MEFAVFGSDRRRHRPAAGAPRIDVVARRRMPGCPYDLRDEIAYPTDADERCRSGGSRSPAGRLGAGHGKDGGGRGRG